jgi:hypothetical protein
MGIESIAALCVAYDATISFVTGHYPLLVPQPHQQRNHIHPLPHIVNTIEPHFLKNMKK